MIDAIRAELLKMRSMPGVWVTFLLTFPLTVLGCLAVFAAAGARRGTRWPSPTTSTSAGSSSVRATGRFRSWRP